MSDEKYTSDEIGDFGELAVKDHLESDFEAEVELSPGSRTMTDVEALFPDGVLRIIQVKASPEDPDKPSADEKRGLNSRATKIKAVPVYARVWLNLEGDAPKYSKIVYYNARTDEIIQEWPAP
ncbi:MAG: hypothetical protein V3W11_05730 [bacterium]